MKQLYLCRHGETEWTLSGQHTGTTDLSLTKKGQEQAALLRGQIAKVEFDAIFTSPKKRALETCKGLPHQKDPDLCEWNYGEYEGKTSEEIQKIRPGWNLFHDGAPGGETADDVGRRADAFLKKALSYSGNVAVFSHGHFLRVLAARYLGLEPKMGKIFNLSVASLSILGYERKQPVVLLWNQIEGP